MTYQAQISPRLSLFARKGAAEPTPAIAYVSLRRMRGETERREEVSHSWDRPGSGHHDRRHFTPRSGTALGQPYVPCAAPEDKADAPEEAAKTRTTKTSVSILSSLIHRRRDGGVKTTEREPEPALDFEPIAATAPPAPFKPRTLRRQVTVRLEINQFLKIKAIADRDGKTRQSIMAAAAADYLDKIDRDRGPSNSPRP